MLKRIVALLLVLVLMAPAAASLAATKKLTANGSMTKGSYGDKVLEAQQLLKTLGYYNGKLDGKYGNEMVKAVKKFQERNHLKADGVLGEKSLKVLKSADVISAAGETQGDSDNGSLVVGSTGGEVMELQNLLTTYGYFKGTVDGVFGTDTEEAVKKFQSRNGLTADGKVGAKTWAALYDTANVIKATDKIPVINTLAIGSSGDAVAELQVKLRDALYYVGVIDGIYGVRVAEAVKEFQASVGLTADGKAGAATQKRLDNYAYYVGNYPKRTLRGGNRGYDVKVLQLKLASMNFLTTSYKEGYYDAATAAAVKKVEKNNNLKEDGIFGKTVRRYLWPVDIAEKDDEEAAEKDGKYDLYRGTTLRLGSTGEEVAYAQMKLKSYGYLLDEADGIFGESTEEAVKKMQKDFGLKEDGIIGYVTWTLVRFGMLAEGAEPTEVDTTKGYVGAITKRLQRGSRGIQVQKLQQILIALNAMPAGEDDGKFGPDTAEAVKKFQKAAGIKEDGIVGSITLSRMEMWLENGETLP